MNHLSIGAAAALLLCAFVTSGCDQTEAVVPGPGPQDAPLPSARLAEVSAHKVSMEHAGDRYRGVEYQLQVRLPATAADRRQAEGLQVEVEFAGKTRDLMGTERVKKPLQLHKADKEGIAYLVRVPSMYRPDWDEQDLSYLLAHTDEIRASWFVDGRATQELLR